MSKTKRSDKNFSSCDCLEARQMMFQGVMRVKPSLSNVATIGAVVAVSTVSSLYLLYHVRRKLEDREAFNALSVVHFHPFLFSFARKADRMF